MRSEEDGPALEAAAGGPYAPVPVVALWPGPAVRQPSAPPNAAPLHPEAHRQRPSQQPPDTGSEPPAAQLSKSRTVVVEPRTEQAPRIRGVLVEYHGPADAGRLHALYEGRNLLGRGGDCTVCIEDPRVSKTHAYIYLDEGGARLVDISVNGTVVSDQHVRGTTIALVSGSRIDLGEIRLTYVQVPELYGS